ncbi:hypothetical protein T8K17_14935 [Thalassobaculum sp. OXR-137]|uniref:hypothetical protein n=1 Tax=Thalassobaculum sp. OXR-137 TaxID=3100173 RepID=UPI002AC8BF26|nr:hypothetical protein [Thalassobaculum sp. OXR-137]WPZ32536.1 hypothetical protein T8K17_14935 [Thalassobaculum sp. OXR-137]
MNTVVAQRDIEQFRKIVEDAASKLVSTQHRPDSSYIQTPLLYPSGANVVVRVDGGPERFTISDFGTGYNEAELMGGTHMFARHARLIAEAAGVGFDHHAFFVVHVVRAQLPGAIIAVSNCSQEAVHVSALRMAERKTKDEVERLYNTLVGVFKKDNVQKDAEVIGASNTKHHVSTLVTASRRGSVFDFVANHHNSIAHASMKFSDIARLETPPERVAVVRNKSEMGTYLELLSQSANVIDREASTAAYKRLVEAA